MPDQTFGYILKNLFPDGLADATYEDPKNAFLALVKKDADYSGSFFEVAVHTTNGGGRSADFGRAKANDNGMGGKRFRLEYIEDYAFARIPNKEMLATRDKEGGIVQLLGHRMKGAMKKMRHSLSMGIVGDGSGVLTTIAEVVGPTTVSGGVTTGKFRVSDRRATRLVEEGDTLKSYSARFGGSEDAGSFTVAGEDDGTGLYTYTTTTGWAPTVGRFIAIDGDYGRRMQGLAAWNPTVAPTAGDNFGGVDRSSSPRKLAGIRSDMRAYSHHEAMITGLEEFTSYGANITHIFMNPFDYRQLELSLASKTVVTLEAKMAGERTIGITGLKLAGGEVVIPDPNFLKGQARCLNMETWCLVSMLEAPHIEKGDGLEMLRVSDADAFEARLVYYANLKCDEPGQNGVILLQDVAG